MRNLSAIAFLALLLPLCAISPADETKPATLALTLRSRTPVKDLPELWSVSEKPAKWESSQTALIVCDMWDKHWCEGANRRGAPIARRINDLANSLRSKGALIIHAPSDTTKNYEGTPQRKLAQNAPKAEPPSPMQRRCSLDEKKEGKLPIDDSDGGCDCTPQCKTYNAWKGEHPAVKIEGGDAISENGQEIFNLFHQRGIKHVLICGVHTNMCVLGRSFGIRQLTTWGFDVALVRDCTDTMYNPRKAPFVPHERGTDLVIAHVEKHWCPTVLSSDVIGDAKPPTVVFAIGEQEYDANKSLPEFAKKDLEPLGLKCILLQTDKVEDLPGTEAIADADLLVIFMRRRTLPDDQLNRFKAHFDAGKPVVGLRTASHAFQNFLEFDAQVLGGHYTGHHGNQLSPDIALADKVAGNPLLRSVTPFHSKGSLYKPSPLADTATPLLIGKIEGQTPEPVAWTNTHLGGRVFYTSLGHPDDFQVPQFRTLLRNGVLWALDKPIPEPKN